MYTQLTPNPLSLTRAEWGALFQQRYGKGTYHSQAFFSHLYRYGNTDVTQDKEFLPVKPLAKQLALDFAFVLPKPENIQQDDGHIKFVLSFGDDLFSESVILKMKTYQALCVSSQAGCRWGCQFCQTGKLGLRGSLRTEHIIAQVLVAQCTFGAKIKNIVFMGMGEALDNEAAVLSALEILTDPYGLHIGAANITLSTVGYGENLEKYKRLATKLLPPDTKAPDGSLLPPYRNIKLAVSLNAADDETRSALMPVNRLCSMAKLKEILQHLPIPRKYHNLFIEYVLIPGVNSSTEDAARLVQYLSDLPCVVNLIPYHPYIGSPWPAPTQAEVQAFFLYLVQHGQTCRLRHNRGENIAAACGQLGQRELH